MKILKRKVEKRKCRIIPDIELVIKVFRQNRKPSLLLYSNGDVLQSGCLSCPDTPCISFTLEELTKQILEGFPSRRDSEVCTLGAITFDLDAETPNIDPEKCIGCGLCLNRCPVGAIFFNEKGVATIAEGVQKSFPFESPETSTHQYIRTHIEKVEKEVNIIVSPKHQRLLKQGLRNRILQNSAEASLFTRNLFLVQGFPSSLSVRGDTNMRIDMLVDISPRIGVCEIERSADTLLDTPRYLIGDIAILISRYRISRGSIFPFIVCGDLPNQRSEYYRVIKDIEDILGITIRTLSVYLLSLLCASKRTVDRNVLENRFYLRVRRTSLVPDLEALLPQFTYTKITSQLQALK